MFITCMRVAVVYINTHIGMHVLHNVIHTYSHTYIYVNMYMFGIYGIFCVVR